MINELKQHIASNKERLAGDWVTKNCSYDGGICNALNMEEDTVNTRYWDASWNDCFIEFKKGKSIWLDLVRYSEILLKLNKAATTETVTLFFIPNGDRTKIEEVIGVSTAKIIDKLGLTIEQAQELVALHRAVPRSLNAQASLTLLDVRNIACFVV